MDAKKKKVLVLGAAGRVGLDLVKALLRHNLDVAAADFIDQKRLTQTLSRAMVDARVARADLTSQISIYGNFDVLNEDAVCDILIQEQPDVVVNYAIPFTWDAAKQLPNYRKISEAGLGAFAAIQVLAPKIIAKALAATGSDATFVVGNLPDITIPIIYGLATHQPLALPIAGAGNVGLIEASLKHTIAAARDIKASDLTIYLVAHHVHWVAPREPGYKNDAPFLLKVCYLGEDITQELGDCRELLNKSIVDCYEPGAAFASTTALLAAQLVLQLLDTTGSSCFLHVPAPNGLPGGFPVIVKDGVLQLDLPAQWNRADAIEQMKQAHQRDGNREITADGSIHFAAESVAILKAELGFDLPEIVTPGDLESVAREQIRSSAKATQNQ